MNKNKKRQFFKKKENKSSQRKHPSNAKSPQMRDPDWKLPAGQFPKNFRFITENLISKFIHKHRRVFLISFVTFLILLAISAVSVDSYRNYQENKIFIQERIGIEKEIKFWQSAVDRFSNYRDAYFELAILNYQLKKFEKAHEYLGKALKLDPNFKEGIEFEKKLDKNI